MKGKSKIVIGITDYVTPPPSIELEAYPNADFRFLECGDDGELVDFEALEEMDALLVWHAHINEKVVRSLKRAKIVVRYGVAYEDIDVEALLKANIPFSNNPDYGTEEVADTAATMILNIVREVGLYNANARRIVSGWQEHTHKQIQRTNTVTVGVVGVGCIGGAVVQRLKAFGCKIIGFDPYVSSGHGKSLGYEKVNTLEELLTRSDIVSVNCPDNKETRGMIDEAFISKMKAGASLVNTARGKIVSNLDIIYHAMRAGKLRSVALDVLSSEPPDMSHPLIAAWKSDEDWISGRLTINPHAAYYSKEAWYEMRYKAAETARLFIEQGILRNQIFE